MWLAFVAATGAELSTGSASWLYQAALTDPRRRREYSSVGDLAQGLACVVRPGLYAWLVIEWHNLGWALLAAIVTAAIASRPAVRAAGRFAEHHFSDGSGLGR